jgi:hypothetical protein
LNSSIADAAAMDGTAVSDYAYSYSDVFQSPDPDGGGIYTLEEAGRETDPLSRTDIRNRYAYDLRMRGNGPTKSSAPRTRGRAEKFSPNEYARGNNNEYPGSSTALRSERWNRPAIDNVMWDERPRSFRPNSSNLHAELFIPPELRPWGDGPSPYMAYPTYSPSHAVSVIDRFSGGKEPENSTCAESVCQAHNHAALTPKTFELGLQMVKVVLFIVLIVLLSMWMIMSITTSRKADLRQAIQEALAAMKT